MALSQGKRFASKLSAVAVEKQLKVGYLLPFRSGLTFVKMAGTESDDMSNFSEQRVQRIENELEWAFVKLEAILDSVAEYEPLIEPDASEREIIAVVDSTLPILRQNQESIKNSLQNVQVQADALDQGIKNVTDNARKETLARKLEIMRKSKKYVFAVAEDKVGKIKALIRSLETKHEKAKGKLIFSNAYAATDKYVNSGRQETYGMESRLPKLELPSFDGHPEDFATFWQSFKSAVDSKPLDNVAKLQYLLSKLRGAAKDAVAGYSVTNESYPEVLATIKRRFGDPEVIIRHLHRELRDIPKSSESVSENRETLERVETICRRLQLYGESSDHQQVRMVVEQKFSHWLLLEIYETKEKNEELNLGFKWTTTELRNAADRILKLREKVEDVQDSCESYCGQKTDDPTNDIHEPYDREQIMEMYYAENRESPPPTAAFGLVQQEDETRCSFCQGGHKRGQCNRYETAYERRKRVQELHLCYRCLKSTHIARNCNAWGKCKECGGPHHSLICTAPWSAMKPNNFNEWCDKRAEPYEPRNSVAGLINSEDRRRQLLPRATWGISSPLLQNVCSKDELVPGYKTHLMTTFVEASDSANSEESTSALAFIDPGSQISIIRSSVAKEMRLEPFAETTLVLTTISSVKPIVVDALVYRVNLWLTDGTKLPLTLYGKDHLTGVVENVHVSEMGKKYLLQYYDAEPDLLIGSDYCWNLNIKPIGLTERGATLLDSKLGYMLAGPANKTKNIMREPLMEQATINAICGASQANKEGDVSTRTDALSFRQGGSFEQESFANEISDDAGAQTDMFMDSVSYCSKKENGTKGGMNFVQGILVLLMLTAFALGLIWASACFRQIDVGSKHATKTALPGSMLSGKTCECAIKVRYFSHFSSSHPEAHILDYTGKIFSVADRRANIMSVSRSDLAWQLTDQLFEILQRDYPGIYSITEASQRQPANGGSKSCKQARSDLVDKWDPHTKVICLGCL